MVSRRACHLSLRRGLSLVPVVAIGCDGTRARTRRRAGAAGHRTRSIARRKRVTMNELRFDGRVAVVTGAGRGIGRAHARLLAARGASVVVNDLGVSTDGAGEDLGPASAVAAEIVAAGGAAIADGSDVATTAGGDSLVAAAIERFGRIDIVVNNAGIIRWAGLP